MGEYNHTLDPKGRVIVPSKFRELLGEEFTLTMGLDGCLYAYHTDAWLSFAAELMKLPGTRDARQLQRYFMSGVATCNVDKQGRTLIPPRHRESAKIEKDIVLVGVLNKVEIWSKEMWDSNNQFGDVNEIAEQMAALGLSF